MAIRLPVSRRYRTTPRFNTSPGIIALLGNPDGLSCRRPQLQLEILTKYGDVTSLRFVFDTGADLMVIPVYVAQREGIAFRTQHQGPLASTLGGSVPCWYDFVEVRSSLSGKLHKWPCAFADSKTAPLVIGRAGFLDDFSATAGADRFVVSYPAPLGRYLRLLFARRPSSGVGQWQPI